MSDTTLILQILLAILQTLNDGGEVTDDKQKELTKQIEEEMERLNS